jgi:hypothetical protein
MIWGSFLGQTKDQVAFWAKLFGLIDNQVFLTLKEINNLRKRVR